MIGKVEVSACNEAFIGSIRVGRDSQTEHLSTVNGGVEVGDGTAIDGDVQSVKLIIDRDTGRSRGFGFVEMDNEGAGPAIEALDGSDFGGRNLRVNEAKEREDRRSSF